MRKKLLSKTYLRDALKYEIKFLLVVKNATSPLKNLSNLKSHLWFLQEKHLWMTDITLLKLFHMMKIMEWEFILMTRKIFCNFILTSVLEMVLMKKQKFHTTMTCSQMWQSPMEKLLFWMKMNFWMHSILEEFQKMILILQTVQQKNFLLKLKREQTNIWKWILKVCYGEIC